MLNAAFKKPPVTLTLAPKPSCDSEIVSKTASEMYSTMYRSSQRRLLLHPMRRGNWRKSTNERKRKKPERHSVAAVRLRNSKCVFTKARKILKFNFLFYKTIETREGWPLLTVETKVNRDSKRTNERGLSLGWFIALVVPVQGIFVLPCCSSKPIHFFNSFVPIGIGSS